ncbi:sodium/calcium exchanger membrane region [Thermocladium modestius]|uniref:Sodium/calcium exchanger membrane region n=1 Tax=Thermocladium modestius TaxID=62609 RepID=A0A830GV79_9CREN|nr:sodium:calcium antiporter [Thermocladium modestius]GGP20232.1 sodium/calcium exchanger membrane region [Thermocladium modestius]
MWEELLGGIAIVMLGSYLFTEGAEGIGSRFSLSASFLGSVVSPVFTSMPEAVVILISMIEGARDVGVGTVFGEPFMAATISYSLVAVSALLGGHVVLDVERSLSAPYILVIAAYPFTLLASAGLHWIGGLILLSAYLLFIIYMRRGPPAGEGEYSSTRWFLPKLLLSIALMPLGSHLLIEGVESTANYLGVGELALSLVLVPLATALPETMSAMIWAFKGRGTLSVGALIGEQVVFSTLYPAVFLLTVGFPVGTAIEWSVTVTTLSSLILLPLVSRRRIPAAALFMGLVPYIAYLIVMIHL